MIEIDQSMLDAYNREMEKFHALRKDVVECNKRVGEEYPSPNIPDMLSSLQKKHGKRRVAMFFANQVNGAPWDGRYSKATKEWASKQLPIPQHPYSLNNASLLRKPPGELSIDMHPIVIDGFACCIIKVEREARAKRRSNRSR